jgi:phosphate-selective porin OprO/OprP
MHRLGPLANSALVIALLSWATFVSTTYAQQATAQQGQQQAQQQSYADLEKRVRDLEATLKRQDAERANVTPNVTGVTVAPQQEQQPAPEASAPAPSEAPTEAGRAMEFQIQGGKGLVAGWDEGFFLRSADNNFHLRITGQIQADYRAYMDDLDFTDIDRFFLRRARLGIEADMFKYYEFRFLPDYGQGQALIQDAYLNVHYWDAFQVEAGKFKQPMSYEQLIQDRYVPTMERSLFDQLVPQRDEGIMLHGQRLFDDRLDWAAAVSNGEINGNTDTNDHKDVNARIAVRPLNSAMFVPAVHRLQIGISGGTGKEQELISPNTLSTPLGVRFFQFNPTVRANGLRNRWSPEVSYFYGGFGFAAQYYEEIQDMQPSFTGPTSVFEQKIGFRGWYFLGTYLVTGEERSTYSEAITPLRSFDPCHPLTCPGAWELVARVSRLRVGDGVFAPGPRRLADPTLYSNGATELTLGFNWYLNKWVRTQCNWEHAWFREPVRLGPGPGGLLKDQDTLAARFQIIF